MKSNPIQSETASAGQNSALVTVIMQESARELHLSAKRIEQRIEKGERAPYMHGAIEGAASDLERLAWSIARRIASFHCGGRAQLKTRGGKAIAKGDALERGCKVRVVVSDGTGGALSQDDIAELKNAARAALLSEVMAGKTLRDSWRAGAKAARRTLYVTRKEPTYDSLEGATRAQDRAFKRASESFASESGEAGQAQPHAAEWLASEGEEYDSPRRIALRAYCRAKRAVFAFYTAKGRYARMQFDIRRDLKTLRAHTRKIMGGEVQKLTVADQGKSEHERMRLFRMRMEQGHALLKTKTEWESLAQSPAAAVKAKAPAIRRTFDLPRTFAEHWQADCRAGALPVVTRLLARTRATVEQLESLAKHFGK